MRRRNREINIFNLSMLDVISGAMAAFLIIMIILFPYYNRTHIDYQAMIDALRDQLVTAIQNRNAALAEAEAMQEQAEQAHAEAAAAQEEAARAQARADSLEKKDLDLMIALDTTLSMEDEMERLKADLNGLVEILDALSQRLRVGVACYTDHESTGDVTRTFPLTEMDAAGLQSLANFLTTQELVSGVDWEEAVEEGLTAAVNQPWNSDAESIIAVIGDARAHADKIARAYELAESFSARGPNFRVSAISASSSDTRDFDFFKELARHGNGAFIPNTAKLLPSIVLSIFEQ